MPDIREILNSLDAKDQKLYVQHRTEMRRSYMTAHNSALGLVKWDTSDDRCLDYIDIMLALVFERSGRMTKANIGEEDAHRIEDELAAASDKIKPSKATEMMQKNGGWIK
jgi:hypothetical protein